MLRVSRFSICLLILSVSTLLSAQEQGQRLSPVITASTAGEKVVRFGSPAAGLAQIRVEILSASGDSLFDSAWKDGNVLDWQVEQLGNGSYRCVVMVKDLDGQVTQKEAILIVEGDHISIEGGVENVPKITMLAHDEKNGAIVNTSGDLTFRFGEFFAGKDTERMRLTAEGNLGIGTDKPQAKLDVNGMIRASEGIMFSDGTVLRMSNGEVVIEKAASANPNDRRIVQTLLPSQPTAIPRRLTPSPTALEAQFKVDDLGVHIGTTPTFGLDVAGNVTLARNLALPMTAAGGTAGVITLAGNPFAHAFGSFNTFIGQSAGNFTMNGFSNTATGAGALQSNTSGYWNTAIGPSALATNSIGHHNTAIGTSALHDNDTGSSNTAIGSAVFGFTNGSALFKNNTGSGNTAVGANALSSNTSGAGNVAVGLDAAQNLTTGDNNIHIRNTGVAAESGTIRIGTDPFHTRAFLAGVWGKTTGVADALMVVIDSAGQLGTVSSSANVKRDIADVGEQTSRLMKLRPVSFFYRSDTIGIRQYGLIAEEVAEVMPELVQFSPTGEAETVRYHFLPPLLLDQVQKQERKIEEQQKTIDALMQRLEALERQSVRSQ